MHGQAAPGHLARVRLHHTAGKKFPRALPQHSRCGVGVAAQEHIIARIVAADERGPRVVA